MRFLFEPPEPRDAESLLEFGRAAFDKGLDGLILTEGASLPAPLVAGAWVAGAVPNILVAAEVPLGDRHPLELAEEAVVVDVASGGRLVLVVRPAKGAEDCFEEALDLIRKATAAAPFRFEGRRWRVPANLEQNVHGVERRTRLTPSPARPRLEIWTAGASLELAAARGHGHLADAAQGSEAWRSAPAEGVAAIGAPRGRWMNWTTREAAVDELRSGREEFGQDWVAVGGPMKAVAELGHWVRPRVQMESLPDGLEEHWSRWGDLTSDC